MKTIKILLAAGVAAGLAGSPAFAHEGHAHAKAKPSKAHRHTTPKKADSSMSNMSAADMKKMDMKPK